MGGGHNIEFISNYPFFCNPRFSHVDHPGSPHYPVSKGNIIIGSDVWIASNVTILSGVSIADGSVIGAGSVVTRSTRPYSINAGVPCRERSRRFSDSEIDTLMKLKWWDLPEDELLDIASMLCSKDFPGAVEAIKAKVIKVNRLLL